MGKAEVGQAISKNPLADKALEKCPQCNRQFPRELIRPFVIVLPAVVNASEARTLSSCPICINRLMRNKIQVSGPAMFVQKDVDAAERFLDEVRQYRRAARAALVRATSQPRA